MADLTLTQGQALAETIVSTYRDMGDGTHALVLAIGPIPIGTSSIGNIGTVSTVTNLAQIGGRSPSMDEVTDAQVVIPVVHHEVHEGEMFVSSYKSADASPIADDAAIMIHIFTGATKFPHFLVQAAAGGDAELQFYEGTTVSNNGTPLADVSMNRARVGTPEVATFHTPTVTADGMELLTLFIPGGTNPRSGGGVIRADTEWVLKRSTHYLARLTNRAGAAQPLGLAQNWYEESNA